MNTDKKLKVHSMSKRKSPKEVASVTVMTPTAEPASAADTTPPVTDVDAAESETQELDIFTSTARVRRHLDKLNINKLLDKLIALVKEQLDKFKTALTRLETKKVTETKTQEVDTVVNNVTTKTTQTTKEERDATVEELAEAKRVVDSTDHKDLERRHSSLSSEKTRFSSMASAALAIVCDELVQQIAKQAMDNTLARGKKIVHSEYLYDNDVSTVPVYPFVKNLPTFSRMSTKVESMKRQTVISTAVADSEKQLKKRFTMSKKPNAVDPEPVVPTTTVATEVEPQEDSKVTFFHYAKLICKDLVEKYAQYSELRFSYNFRDFLSKIVVEFIERLAPLVLLMTKFRRNKTVDETTVMSVLEFMLVDGHKSEETITTDKVKAPDAKFIKDEHAKKKTDENYQLAEAPMVDAYVTTRTFEFPTSYSAKLRSLIDTKLQTIEESKAKKAAESEVAAAAAAAASTVAAATVPVDTTSVAT